MSRLRITFRRFFAHREPWVFVAALVIILGIWGFAAITEDVVDGDTIRFDSAILHAFRQPADQNLLIGPTWMLTVVRDATALGGALVMGLLIATVAGFLLLMGRVRTVGFLLIATVGATAVNSTIKHLIERPRPTLVPHLTDVSSASFPSGHSAMSAAVYLTLGALLAQSVKRRRVKIYFISIAMLMTGLVGISRVALGVHYPSDVLAGWSTGLVWALLCWLVARYLQRRGAIEKEVQPLDSDPADA